MSVATNQVRSVLVLLSGGQDSTTALFWARRECPDARIHALTVHYGQRHEAEVGAAAHIALLAGCASHDVVDLAPVLGASASALTNKNLELTASGGFRDDEMPEGLPTSFVPGRNLVFLAVAAAYAARYRCQWLVTGVCQTDYSGYPDCRGEFVEAMDRAIQASLPTELRPVSVVAPLLDATKAETVQLMYDIARTRDANAWMALSMSVTCYHGKRPGCGTCPACQLRAKGFSEAGVPDPADPAMPPPRELPPATGVPVTARGSSELSPYEAARTPRKDPRDRFAAPVKGHDHTTPTRTSPIPTPWNIVEDEVAEEVRRDPSILQGPDRSADEVDAFEHPERVLKVAEAVVGPPGRAAKTVLVRTRNDAIELRSEDGFTLREAADALDYAGIPAGSVTFDALDFRMDIQPDRPVGTTVHVVETGTRTIELTEEDLQRLADESVAAPDSAGNTMGTGK